MSDGQTGKRGELGPRPDLGREGDRGRVRADRDPSVRLARSGPDRGLLHEKKLTVREGAVVKGKIKAETPLSPAAEFAEIARLVHQRDGRDL